MGFSLGLYLLFDFVTGFIQLPAFTSLSLKFLPLFFLAYSTDFIRTFIVALLGGILSWWMPSNWDIGMPVAYILDYMVPVLAISIATFIKPLKSDDKLFNWINWFIFLTIPTIIIYFSRVLAGYFFYGAEAWDGYGILVYSMVLNAINTTFDYLLFIIIVPPICTTLRYISTRLK
ncbi:energy-coupled thiamine transporter ThiT [[Acholeplasma] multilocale]|uniref:energy-coupled thiamine transporter ThiT n=1 Tax=[Acholeplasma] multilocale TaxID=264638 RepID=UPI00244E03B7|nr:energy-coupled thiamine transporter ThiT [[Acholeplasma] multilocale]